MLVVVVRIGYLGGREQWYVGLGLTYRGYHFIACVLGGV